MNDNTLIYLDLETGGLEWWPVDGLPMRPIIQFAAIAHNPVANVTHDSLEMKIAFKPGHATAEALEINHYAPENWNDAMSEKDAAHAIIDFVKHHRNWPMVSAKGKCYSVAQPAGHNISTFDRPFLTAWLKLHTGGAFIPMDFQSVDTLSLARMIEHLTDTRFSNLRLETLARELGHPMPEGSAHDTLADVRATIDVHHGLLDMLDDHYAPQKQGVMTYEF